MYHPQSQAATIKRRRSNLALVAALVVGVVLAVVVFFAIQGAVREPTAQSMRQAVLSSALECYAIEGAFPASLGYLQDHYGLVVNERDFMITYECYADNVAPSVVVVPR